MNLNSNNNTRDGSSTKGGNTHLKWEQKEKINGVGAGGGRVICLMTCSPEISFAGCNCLNFLPIIS